MEEKSRVSLFGYSKSRLEVFLNGLAFLIIQVVYEAVILYDQLPVGEDGFQRPILIPMILFIAAYLLTDLAIFGGEGEDGRERRVIYLTEKYGAQRILLWKLSLTLGIIFVSLLFPIYILTIFF